MNKNPMQNIDWNLSWYPQFLEDHTFMNEYLL